METFRNYLIFPSGFKFAMILGRLELFAILPLFVPSFGKILMIEKKQTWLESILVYKDIRMLRILLLGAISGFHGY